VATAQEPAESTDGTLTKNAMKTVFFQYYFGGQCGVSRHQQIARKVVVALTVSGGLLWQNVNAECIVAANIMVRIPGDGEDNDVEEWHHRLNSKAQHCQFNVYQMAPLLHKEAQFVTLLMALVSEGRLHLMQQKAHESTQGCLHVLWG